MQVDVKMEVKPWVAPDHVEILVGGEIISIPLGEAPHGAVKALVGEWLADVYRKAGMLPDWRFE